MSRSSPAAAPVHGMAGGEPGAVAAWLGIGLRAEVLPFHPSRVDYERIALRLCRYGVRFSRITLSRIDLAVLCYLAGQGPGICHHHATIGEALGLGHDAVHDALHRLRNSLGYGGYGVALVHAERVKIGDRLPSGKRSRTKTNRYWLTGALHDLLSDEEAHRARVAAAKSKTIEDQAEPSVPPPAETKPRRGDCDLAWAEPELQAVAKSFDILGLPTRDGGPRRPCSSAELQALRNRVAEGCTPGELRAAVAGAEHTVWQRPNGTPWALDPFAVVFKKSNSVRRFAEKGRSVIGAAVTSAQSLTSAKPSSMTAPEPSSPRSPRSLDRDPPSKIARAFEPETGSTARGLKPAKAASETPSAPVPSCAKPDGPRPKAENGRQRGELERKPRRCDAADAAAAKPDLPTREQLAIYRDRLVDIFRPKPSDDRWPRRPAERRSLPKGFEGPGTDE